MKIIELFEHKQLEFTRSRLIEHLASDGNLAEAERVAQIVAARPDGDLRRVYPLGAEQPAAIIAEKKGGENFILKISSHYFVGIDWIIPGVLAVRVRPKIDQKSLKANDGTVLYEIDVLGMLNEIVNVDFDSKHYEGLLSLYTETEPIEKGGDTVGMYQFLIADYIAVLKRITQKGLRRQYLARQEIYKRKLHGRVLWSKTFSKPSAHLADRIACEPVIFTRDTDENRYLKAGLIAAGIIMGNLPDSLKSESLRRQFRYVLKAFGDVSNTDESTRPRFVKTNPVFKDYSLAIEMTRSIFDMESIGYARDRSTATVLPHWLYMPKLFELYVYAKLMDVTKPEDRLAYHLKLKKQELDYLCNIKSLIGTAIKNSFAIIDAKYKLSYDNESGAIELEDARQLSGYARFKPIYKKLIEWKLLEQDSSSKTIIPCLIIHPTLNPIAPTSIDFSRIRESNNWLDFYLLDIRLPVLH